jgi:hypothetical protein
MTFERQLRCIEVYPSQKGRPGETLSGVLRLTVLSPPSSWLGQTNSDLLPYQAL